MFKNAYRLPGVVLIVTILFAAPARADLMVGLISDFNDGTTQGWSPPRSNTTNPSDFLEVSPATRLAAFNANVNGNIDPAVVAITADLMRPDGQSDLEMRLVLFGPGTTNRWTSTQSQIVPGDGIWRNYEFSIFEADLTQALGTATYTDLTSNLNRIMFRVDTGAPSGTGTPNQSGTFGLDNVVAIPIPEPNTLTILAIGGLVIIRRHNRKVDCSLKSLTPGATR